MLPTVREVAKLVLNRRNHPAGSPDAGVWTPLRPAVAHASACRAGAHAGAWKAEQPALCSNSRSDCKTDIVSSVPPAEPARAGRSPAAGVWTPLRPAVAHASA